MVSTFRLDARAGIGLAGTPLPFQNQPMALPRRQGAGLRRAFS
jgi:hypothetical protein